MRAIVRKAGGGGGGRVIVRRRERREVEADEEVRALDCEGIKEIDGNDIPVLMGERKRHRHLFFSFGVGIGVCVGIAVILCPFLSYLIPSQFLENATVI